MNKETILKELKIQEKIQGKIENKELILKILEVCKYKKEFLTFMNVDFHKYGKYSYQTYRLYSINPRFMSIFKRAEK